MFEWEEARRRQNMEEHGVDFVRAALMFENPVLEREDTRQFHGERRFLAIGHVGGFFMVVVWTPRGSRRRIVQAWRADRDDEAIYGATVPFAGAPDGGLYGRDSRITGKPRSGFLARGRAALSLPKPQAGRLRLDPEVLDWFGARHEDPHTGINAVLRAYVERRRAGGQGKA